MASAALPARMVIGMVIGTAFAAAAHCATSPAARAEHVVYDDRGLTVAAGLSAGASAIATDQTNFGAGLPEPNGDANRHVRWLEGFAHPSLRAAFDSRTAGRLFGETSVIGALTRGDGDASGATFGRPEKIAHERLYIGWSSGALWPALGEDAIRLSWGDQDFELGDGFLISDGRDDRNGDAALYLGPRNAFKKSAVLALDTEPVRASAFFLDSHADQGGTHLAGASVEYRHAGRWRLGLDYFKILGIGAGAADFTSRDGLDVVSLRGQGHPGDEGWAHDLFLAFEMTFQHNGRPGREVNARAWYAEAGYTFPGAPWTPSVGYRFSAFTGDDPGTTRNETFDPLFVGAPRGWGTWFQGEITGQYLFTNRNLDVHMARIQLQPTDSLALHAFFFDFDFDEPTADGASDSDFAREVNLIADWQLDPRFKLSALYGAAIPQAGGKQAFGAGKVYQLFGLIGSFEL